MMTTTDEDQAVLRYVAAIEARRSATENLPQPGDAADALAGAGMVTGDDSEGLARQLSEQTPGSEAYVRSLEDDFVQAAAAYSTRNAVTYESWRNAGVDHEVLERAGIRPVAS